jgi:hypothetical protein
MPKDPIPNHSQPLIPLKNKNKTNWNQKRVSFDTLLVQPLSNASNSRTRRLSDGGITILKSSVDVWPHLVHVGTDKLRASLHDHTKCHECCTALVWVSILGEFEDFFVEAWEYLLRREGSSQCIESADTKLCGSE